MLWFKQSSSQMDFRLIITEDSARPHEYALTARNELEAVESASSFAERVCAESSGPVSVFLLDAHGVFLADLATAPHTSEMIA